MFIEVQEGLKNIYRSVWTIGSAGEGFKPRPNQPNRSAKLLIIQAINLHPLNLVAPPPESQRLLKRWHRCPRTPHFLSFAFCFCSFTAFICPPRSNWPHLLSTSSSTVSVRMIRPCENLRCLRCKCENSWICLANLSLV